MDIFYYTLSKTSQVTPRIENVKPRDMVVIYLSYVIYRQQGVQTAKQMWKLCHCVLHEGVGLG